MMEKIKKLLGINKDPKKYESISDFFKHASSQEQSEIFTKAAQLANEDQMRIFKKAQFKN